MSNESMKLLFTKESNTSPGDLWSCIRLPDGRCFDILTPPSMELEEATDLALSVVASGRALALLNRLVKADAFGTYSHKAISEARALLATVTKEQV